MNLSHTIMVERLKEQMDKKGLNARELAEQASVGKSFVYDILSGKSTNPTTSKLISLARVLGVSVPYLIYEGGGEANIANDINSQQVTAIRSLILPLDPILTTEKEEVHYFRTSWIKERLRVSAEYLRVVMVRGDSMEPTLSQNDITLVDTSQNIPSPPGLFILFDGIGLIAKRLEYISCTNPPMVRVASDNPQYTSYDQPFDNLKVIGRVMWLGREV